MGSQRRYLPEQDERAMHQLVDSLADKADNIVLTTHLGPASHFPSRYAKKNWQVEEQVHELKKGHARIIYLQENEP